MQFGICLQFYIPMRREPSESSEMVSQVLFGEVFEIIESHKESGFVKIQLDFDNYQGWIDQKTIFHMEAESYDRLRHSEQSVCSDLINTLHLNSGKELKIGAGSSLWTRNNHIVYPEVVLSITSDLRDSVEDLRKHIPEISKKWQEIPYLWGGRSVYGADCSGFVQNIFKQAGISLPRDAGQQAETGSTINFVSEAKPGDLAFFDNEEGIITHVGLLLGEGRIIHSSGKIKTDYFDHQGIFSETRADYTHKLRVIKNVID